MALNKVEICGVNTARLPILTNEEKDALFNQIRQAGGVDAADFHFVECHGIASCD